MNVDIRHKQYDNYVAHKHMNDNQQALHKAFQASRSGYVESTPSSSSSGTHSYGMWSKGLMDWQAFDEVTSHPSGTANVAQGNKPWLLKIMKMMMRTTTWVSRMMPRMKMMSDLMG
jgi:hypothetical protein